jgi:hypothetical protein
VKSLVPFGIEGFTITLCSFNSNLQKYKKYRDDLFSLDIIIFIIFAAAKREDERMRG